MDAKLLFLHVLSPLHAGIGQGVGVIDLPIAREKSTGIPYLPGSSLKGVLRNACDDEDLRNRVFGPDPNNADAHAGSVQFTDVRLLLLPVRSISGVFAWVTSPLLLRRFQRDAANVGNVLLPQAVPEPANGENCTITDQNCEIAMTPNGFEQVVLEDLLLTAESSADVTAWAAWLGTYLFPNNIYWQTALKARLCIVHDDVLSFLLETATEITARIRLDEEKKTVAQGALWYEESLPTETILSGLVVAANVESTAREVFSTVQTLTQGTLQVGGNATVGRGLCQVRLV